MRPFGSFARGAGSWRAAIALPTMSRDRRPRFGEASTENAFDRNACAAEPSEPMSLPSISAVELCPYRRPTEEPRVAVCRLLERLAGDEVSLDAHVHWDACHTCCRPEAAEKGRVKP